MTSEFDTALAQIPVFGTDSRKEQYITYRSVGFNVTESLEMAKVKRTTLLEWRKRDKEFKSYESDTLPVLQSTVAKNILRLQFQRNFFQIMEKDMEILQLARDDIHNLSDRQWTWLKNLRGHYTPSDMLALEKALEPERHKDKITFNLVWDTQQPRIEAGPTVDSPAVITIDDDDS